jgi:hypothetical protein
MSAAKRLMFEQMDQDRREDLIAHVRDALLCMVSPDAAHMYPLAERIVDGGGTRAQRQAVINVLLDRCDPDAYDAALDLEGVQ